MGDQREPTDLKRPAPSAEARRLTSLARGAARAVRRRRRRELDRTLDELLDLGVPEASQPPDRPPLAG